jgi:DNA repair protein RadC
VNTNTYLRPASPAELYVKRPSGRYRVAEPQEITAVAADILEPELRARDVLTSPDATRDYFKARLRGYPHEVFAALFLDNRHRAIAYQELFRGTVDGASVHPREVVREAIKHNAAAVIFAHNHPSGVTEPSQADMRITERLQQALGLIDVRVLDHFVIGEGRGVSFAERGLV